MKTFFAIFALLAVMLAVYPFLDESEDKQSVTGLPWQIEVLPDATTQVFGIHVGVSTLADAFKILGHDMELAIIAATDEAGSLEMYYGHYRAGLLSGKLVLQTKTGAQKISSWRQKAVRSEYMATGMAKKYYLSEDDLKQVTDEVITGLTFIPAVNLDEEVIVARFGQPDERIQQEAVTHFLYPEKGLDIVLSAEAKEVLQYVSPDSFKQLTAPLQSAPLQSRPLQ